MLFNNRRPQGNGRHGNGNAQRVVGEARRQSEGLRYVRDRVEIHFFRLSRIGVAALQQGNLFRPAPRAARTASSISASVPMPVDTIIGLPVLAIFSISGKSTNSKDATL